MESLHLSFQRVVDARMFKGITLSSSLMLSHMFYADDVIFVGQWCDDNINTLVQVLECFFHASGLHINMNKSKLMGVLVDDEKVKQAASKLGCLILKPPFSYLGSKVGGSMHRIQAWNEVVDRVYARLSKWKMKTLSIGGRLTLLKSVLGSMPIYHMSIFRVPMSVLRRLESIRSHFFNGHDPNSKRTSWVKWKNVLASKEKGGLGVSSLYALNRGLMFKWVWRFFTQNTSLWSRVIKAIHGEDGKVGKQVKSAFPSYWMDIVHEINVLKNQGINLLNCMQMKLGNGDKTAFWEDIWIGHIVLKDLYPRIYALETCKFVKVGTKLTQSSLDFSFRRKPRGGIEQEQYEALLVQVQDVNLVPVSDRWKWSLENSGDFSVASVRKMLDDKMLPDVTTKTRWIKLVPIKVNVHAWKVKIDSLPTRFNISRRGMDIESITCSICDNEVESSSHLFFKCNMVRDIIRKITRWWDITYIEADSYEDWLNWLVNLRLSSNYKQALEGVFYVMWWHVWQYRNKYIFEAVSSPKAMIFEDIVSRSFYWCRNRCLDDSYMQIRSSILSTEVLPDVRSVYATISSEESHRVVVGSIAGPSQRNQASAFVSNVPNSQNFQRTNQNFSIGPLRSNHLSNNRQGRGSGLNNNKQGGGSEANQHMTYTDKELDNVIDISHLRIKVGHPNGTEAYISMIRNLRLSNGLTLYDVMVIPEYCVTLTSVHKLAKENKMIVAFDENKCYFLNQDLSLKMLGHPAEPVINIPNDDERVANDLNKGRSDSSSSFVSGGNINTIDFPVDFGNDANSSDEFVATQNEEAATLEENVFSKGNLDQNPSSSHEIYALLRNGTWEIVKLPKGRKPIGSKWIYKIKFNSSGEIDRYKARLVAQGFRQKEGIDYEETFSHVVKMVTLRGNMFDLLSDYGMLACKPAKTPLMFKLVISNEACDNDPLLENVTDYQNLMGKLIYLTNTRPDISYVVHCLSQFMHSPLSSHRRIAFKILRYLKSCPGLGIHIAKTFGMFLNVYFDVDWAKCIVTRKYVTGYCVFLNNFLVSWKSKKQNTLSKSSIEAEYRALASVTSEVIWILKILKDLQIENLLPVLLHCDSNSAIKIVVNPVFHERTKHLEIDLHFVREKILKGVVKTVKVDFANQIADILTKGLDTMQHNFLENLGMLDIY
ncbi:RNA-directed DNA polymerase, eukaryota, reverse transcriptase zinc-binding domain protein [Tanacetum coccineum]